MNAEVIEAVVAIGPKTAEASNKITKILRDLENELGRPVNVRSVRPAMDGFEVCAQILLVPDVHAVTPDGKDRYPHRFLS